MDESSEPLALRLRKPLLPQLAPSVTAPLENGLLVLVDHAALPLLGSADEPAGHAHIVAGPAMTRASRSIESRLATCRLWAPRR
jgi:hypothetical protein